ncbi:1e8d168b-e760-44da-832c-5a386a288e7e [Sclerotinia trifoliorum]|uniref:1e8d168b-e760-44da-832c-5a386a288e7e n=1 Tax=Sclerotinia trifoliorum TaxID=28548 RepID=A0A8H2VX31_9HELO|nr:1e8d168b-e760-44da-832c-5a386a288e7e [Sclerotinia trifoliorum]
MLNIKKVMSIIPAAEIPTVSLLYHLKKLTPYKADTTDEITATPNQSFNDRIGLIRGDITHLEVDAIVNAANNSLLGGGGVDGAIHCAAGPDLLRECRTLNGCRTGSAKITDAYELPCKKVIHAVGPVYDSYKSDVSEERLEGCYKTSLDLAVENGCKTIAFSALSTGVYGYPSDEAAPVALMTVRKFLESEKGSKMEKIIFCTFVARDVAAYNKWIPRIFPSTEPDAEEEWEEVDEVESAENGAVLEKGTDNVKDDAEASKVELPEVPTKEPIEDEGHAAKKQKSEDDEKL